MEDRCQKCWKYKEELCQGGIINCILFEGKKEKGILDKNKNL